MRKKIISVLVIFTAFMLNACIEFVQDIEINDDGSGRYTFKVDLGMLQYANPSAMSENMGFIASIREFPAKAVERLSGAQGISELENITDENSGIYGFRFKFVNDKALNKSLYQLADQQKMFFMPNYIKIKKKKIIITDIAPYIKKANSMRNDDPAQAMMMEQIQPYIKVTTRIHLTRVPKKTENLRSKTEQQQVIMTATMSDLVKGVNYGNKIKY